MFQLAYVSGATSGIGMALARLLAKEGIPLLLTGRDIARLDGLVNELKPLVPVQSFTADFAEESGRRKAAAEIRKHVPDLIINNAGFGLYGPAVNYPVDKQVEVVQVDATAVFEMTLEAAQVLKEQGRKGVILNVSSAAAFQVFPYFAAYAASKAFVNSVSESLDFELKDQGIRVLTACPGQVSTRFSERASGKALYVNEGFLVMSVEEAAEAIYRQIQLGKRLNVFNWKYKVLSFFSRLLPASLSAALVKRVVARRAKQGV
jgi:short-subunit dehydrogenase